jgi:Asp-tRNA(Asn)/Glu-tRNA(Gln) amidotransferase A subunit family amidase
VSNRGSTPVSPRFDTIGPLGRDVATVAAVYEAIAGYDANDNISVKCPVDSFAAAIGNGVDGLRIGIPESFFYEDIDAEIGHAMESAIKIFAQLGAKIKKINLERYLNQLISKVGVSVDKSDVKNLQKVIGTSLSGKYSLFSIYGGNYKSVDNFINHLYAFIRHFEASGPDVPAHITMADREYYFKELMDQYKKIYNRSSNFKKEYEKSYNWIIKNHSSKSEEDVLIIEIISKSIELGSKIFDMIYTQEANSIQDMRIVKSKVDTLKNLLNEDVFLLPDRIQAIFKYFNDLSDVTYYIDRVNKKDLEETKEKLKHIEKAINSILK